MKGIKIFFISIVLLFSVTCFSQPNLPPVYEINADTAVSNIPDTYWQMLVDSSGKWNISDVTSMPLTDKFHSNNSAATGYGYSNVKHYWQRLRLKNNTAKELKLIFLNTPVAFQYDIYVYPDSGQMYHMVSGWGVAYSKRDGFASRRALPVTLHKGETVTIYKRLNFYERDSGKELSIGFNFYEPFVKNSYVDESYFLGDTRHSFIAGLMIFGFFLNIFFYRIAREKVYLYYSLLLLLEGLWYITTGIEIFRENPVVGEYFDLILTYSAFFFCVAQFVRYFLKTYKYYPRWDKFLLTLIIMLLVVTFIRVLVDPRIPYSMRGVPSLVQNIFFSATMLSLLVTFFFPKKEKDQFTNLSIVAAVPAFLVWSVIYGVPSIYVFFETRFGAKPPESLMWVRRNSAVIEMFCVGWFAVVFSWILLQRYSQLRKEFTRQALARERERNELISQQKELLEKQVEERTLELKNSLEDLKTTQVQLIQSEKMASLGELTAGIAHEIQNPLNFVNNFSEVNNELIEELKVERSKAEDERDLRAEENLLNDISQNLEKINYHGKRADAIVKGMLQHSRASSGKKEPTDINTMADEYLRLSYHGLRAKDKTFNADFKTSFDETIGKINVIPQDIGRVLLNLFNNSFYSVNEKKKATLPTNGEPAYEPMVYVSTKKVDTTPEKIEIIVRDNGSGIPQAVLDKIYQPFFTTKPTGQGTGLGLSMSYDIIKSHGGELRVETKEGEFAEFIISIPYIKV